MKTTTVELPSGLEVTIRKPGVLTVQKMCGGLPSLSADGKKGPEPDTAESVEALLTLVCRCCVDPKFVPTDEPKDGERSIEDLTLEDWNVLQAEVLKFSGFPDAEEVVGPLSETGTS